MLSIAEGLRAKTETSTPAIRVASNNNKTEIPAVNRMFEGTVDRIIKAACEFKKYSVSNGLGLVQQSKRQVVSGRQIGNSTILFMGSRLVMRCMVLRGA